jgi:hypothetical protein
MDVEWDSDFAESESDFDEYGSEEESDDSFGVSEQLS